MMHYEILEKLYLTNPTHVSNIALWKQVDFMKKGQTFFKETGGYNHLYIVYEKKLFFYYSWKEENGKIIENKESILFKEEDLMKYEFSILNSTQYALLDIKKLKIKESTPFVYIGKKVPVNKATTDEFEVAPFDFENDFEEAAELINRCQGWSYTAKKVKQFTVYSAFDPDLWIWITDKKTKRKVALGIGDFFKPINEGTLCWMQVDPEFGNEGIGMFLVESLINIILKKGGNVRANGMKDEFYKKCNLAPTEKWYILKNKDEVKA